MALPISGWGVAACPAAISNPPPRVPLEAVDESHHSLALVWVG